MVTFAVIITMLLLVYRSIVTVLLVLVTVCLTLSATRGVVAFLGYHDLIGLSTFATNLLVTLAIAATTDYAIFLVGRYQEARTIGEDRESAYYTMFHGTAHVVLGSGMTIAGATFCLSFTRLPYFQSLGSPARGRNGRRGARRADLGPGDDHRRQSLRTAGTQARHADSWLAARSAPLIVRWPGPILVATIALSLVGLLTLPGYKPNYNDRNYLPADLPANAGIRGGRTAFLRRRDDEPGAVAHRDRPRPSQLGGLPGDRQDRQGRLPGARHRQRPGDHPSGTANPLKFSTIPAQISLGGVPPGR